RDEDLSRFNINRKYNKTDDLYVALGREDLPVGAVLEHLTPVLQNRGEMKPEMEPVKNGYHTNGESAANEVPQVVVRLANCCCPLPGDAITGFLKPDKGFLVH